MKKTALYNEHLALGAKMVDFSGWQLPVMYQSIIEEHMAVRQKAGIFDISHMGEFWIEGETAESFLTSIIPTRLSKLVEGSSIYSCLPSQTGGIIDDLFIFKYNSNRFYLVVNASRIETDLEWLQTHAPESIQITDQSQNTSKIDLQGPRSQKIMARLLPDSNIENLKRFQFIQTQWKGTEIMVSATGYTGESGYEIYLPNNQAVAFWQTALNVGKADGLIPCGLGARDSLRLEAGYSLYGHELSESISPVEAGLGWLISSEASYSGKEILLQQKSGTAERELIAFILTEKGIPREQYPVLINGEEVGTVTSGCFSPVLQQGIGLALVKKGTTAIDKPLSIMVRKKEVLAKRVKRPFYPFQNWEK